MRKFGKGVASILLALAMVIGMFGTGIVGERVSADASFAKVTAIYGANQAEVSDSTVQVDTVTIADGGHIGGKIKWDYGVIAIEPAEGYTVKSVKVGGETVSTTSLGADKSISGVPASFNESISSITEGAVILESGNIGRPVYEYRYAEKDIVIEGKDSSNNPFTMKVSIDFDRKYIEGDTYNVGAEINLFSEGIVSKLKAAGLTDEAIEIIKYQNSIQVVGSNMERTISPIEGQAYKYRATEAGVIEVTYKNPNNGLWYCYNFHVAGAQGVINDVIVSSNAEWGRRSDTSIIVSAKDSNPISMKEYVIKIKKWSGATIDWTKSSYFGTPITENGTANARVSFNRCDKDVAVTHSVENEYDVFTITSEDAVEGFLTLCFKAEGNEITNEFRVSPYMPASMRGHDTYYVTYNQRGNLFDYMNFQKAEDKAYIIQRIIDDKIEVDMPGAELVFGDNNGQRTFDGTIVFTHSGDYISLIDKELNYQLFGGVMNVVCQNPSSIPDGNSSSTVTEPVTPEIKEEIPTEPKVENNTQTKEDGTVVETEKFTAVDGSTKETIVETAVDGAVVETIKEVSADGKTVETIKEVSADGKSSASSEVKKDENGNVTESVVTIESQTKNKKLTVNMDAINNMIAKNDSATKANTTVVLTANDKNGNEKYTVEVDAKVLKADAKLTVYALDKNGKPVMVDQSKNSVKVSKDGDVQIKIDGQGDFTVVSPSEAKRIEKQIEKSVKPAKSSVSVDKGKKATFKLDSDCNMGNIKMIIYSSNNGKVKVNQNGKITANGNATITATVTLANGNVKKIKMKVKVK